MTLLSTERWRAAVHRLAGKGRGDRRSAGATTPQTASNDVAVVAAGDHGGGSAPEPGQLGQPGSGSRQPGLPVRAARSSQEVEAQLRQLAAATGWPMADDLSICTPAADFVRAIPISYARRHGVLGLAADGDNNGPTPLALSSVSQLEHLEILSRHLNRPLTPLLAPPQAIAAAINEAYQQQTGQADALVQKLDESVMAQQLAQIQSAEDLLDVATRAPVIQLVNLILFEAIKQRASDVHLQPREHRLEVRMRIDGVLFSAYELPKAMQEEIVSRVKVMGRMNIAEKRLPQDGRATVQVGDRIIDLRIASLPGSHGERLVLRLLDKSSRLLSLEQLGMDAWTFERFRDLIGIEHGLVLVTGPTGSGKTTTLYAALQQIDCSQRNVLTLEDPIEYQLPGVSQTQVNTRKGLTFASGLRSVLRQDPDIIMVGEIRDHETAVMAIQSALTGHLVFSTLHTNDAASAVTRLLDLGIEPYLAASSLVGVLAQRLVRTICEHCAQPASPGADDLARLDLGSADLTGATLRQGAGCPECRGTGLRGRVGLFELLRADEPIRRLIQQRQTASSIRSAAIEAGMKTLRDQGVARVLSGQTTIDEVVRVTVRSTI